MCHDLFVQVPWCGELGLEFQFFSVVKLEAHAILEELDDIDGRMFFITKDILKTDAIRLLSIAPVMRYRAALFAPNNFS